MKNKRVDCVIVGGGIGGAVLALALGRAGHSVAVLERELQPVYAGRPEVLAAATLEVFDSLGAGERIRREACIALETLEAFESPDLSLLKFTKDEFERYHFQPYSTEPNLTRAILLEAASATASVEIIRGVDVQEILRTDGRITGVRAVRAGDDFSWECSFLVGDDGGRSRVRQALGIPLEVRNFAADFLASAGPAPEGFPAAGGRAVVTPKGFFKGIFGGVFMPQPQGRMACVFLLAPSAAERILKEDSRSFYGTMAPLFPICREMGKSFPFPQSFKIFKRPFGNAPSYAAPGAAILGDAAHPFTPAGGQGANASVADAAALGEDLLEAFRKDDFSKGAFSRYEALRRPANARSLSFSSWTDGVIRLFAFAPFLGGLFPPFVRRQAADPGRKERFIRAVSTAFRSQETTSPGR